MKAGTTWLYEQLKNHPEVAFTPEKEIHYFANKVGIENQLNHRARILKLKSILGKYHNGNAKFISENIDEISWYTNYAKPSNINNDWYESLFEGVSKDSYCADFSNLYCQMGQSGWANVLDICEEPKIIYTLRSPMKRLWSHYKFHHKWTGKEDNVIDDGFDVFKETLSRPWFYNNMDYAGNLRRVLEGVGKQNVLLLYFEDFRTNPQVEADKITSFLDISRMSIAEDSNEKIVNATKDFSMPSEWRDYASEKLEPYIDDMKALNIFHKSW